ncbi:MAG: NUDIX hydrolase [Clostridiales Family XIII bacterium]|jgi:ADP-ribose pyrophosphatase|nr:NUDIX hydrolase [Clostridiales Family XIII bacterium]
MIFEEKTLASEMIYEGRILNLRRDKVTTRAGESYREIVEHNGGVVIIAITPEGKVPMVRQFRKAAEAAVLEVPAGKLEFGEDPAAAALRELREETGYSAARIRELSASYSSIGYSTEVLRIYLAQDLTAGETDFDPAEAIDVVEYTPGELYAMAIAGELHDLKTITAVLLVHELMKTEEARGAVCGAGSGADMGAAEDDRL